MVHQTDCPACGAPLEYDGEQAIVQCGFCNAEVHVVEEDGVPKFHVLSQPEPQGSAFEETVEDVARNPDQDPIRSDQGDPASPSYASGATMLADPDAYSPESIRTGVPADAATISETPAHYQMPPVTPDAPVRNNRNRNIGIGIAVLVLLCLLLACGAGLAAFFSFGLV
jgi:hypothetical protein